MYRVRQEAKLTTKTSVTYRKMKKNVVPFLKVRTKESKKKKKKVTDSNEGDETKRKKSGPGEEKERKKGKLKR